MRVSGGAARVAAVDCGTNSLRLLIADVDPAAGTLADVTRRMEIVRLGEGVDATGRLAAEPLARTLRVLAGYAATVNAAGVAAVRMVATSATRDSSNAAEFVVGATEVLGVAPEVLSGDEEARLSFTGATRGLPATARAPYLVADIGGGSTEFVTGDAGGVTGAVSVDIGCVRMTERHLSADPPDEAAIAAATADIDGALARAAARVPVGEAVTLVGLAGSVTTVTALALGLPGYDPARIHHAVISAADVRQQASALLAATRPERARLGPMHPGRVDVIAAGALILSRIMTRFSFAEVLASEHDILDGLAWSLADGGWA